MREGSRYAVMYLIIMLYMNEMAKLRLSFVKGATAGSSYKEAVSEVGGFLRWFPLHGGAGVEWSGVEWCCVVLRGGVQSGNE